MQKVYFIRHGETVYNNTGRLQGRTDIPLDERGIEEAQIAAKFFREKSIAFDRVYASPLSRARKTAQIVSGFPEDEIFIEDLIVEMNFGDQEGGYVMEMPQSTMNLFYKPEKYIPPRGGESIDALKVRCAKFLRNLGRTLQAEPGLQSVLVVSHGGVMRGLISVMEHRPLEKFWVENIENCCTVAANFDHGVFRIDRYMHPLEGTRYLAPPWKGWQK